MRSIIDNIAHKLPFPIFFSNTQFMAGTTNNDYGEDPFDGSATVLAHAVQLLLFSPTKWHSYQVPFKSG